LKEYKKIGNFKFGLLFLGILFVFSLSVSPSTATHVDNIYTSSHSTNWNGHSLVFNDKTVSDPKATLLNSTKSTQNKYRIADRTVQSSGKVTSKYKPPAVPGGQITNTNNEYDGYVYPGSIDVMQGEKFFVQRPFDNFLVCHKDWYFWNYQGYWNPSYNTGKGITLLEVNIFGAWFVCDGIISNGTSIRWKTMNDTIYKVNVRMKVFGPL
jgi:hypothetical protein